MMSDPIADMITRIRNGLMARHDQVEIPYSKLKERCLYVLDKEGYIKSFKKNESTSVKATLVVELKYVDDEKAVQGIKRISQPGRRVYTKVKNIPYVFGGLGINVISTSGGVVSDREARKKNLGGEILFTVW